MGADYQTIISDLEQEIDSLDDRREVLENVVEELKDLYPQKKAKKKYKTVKRSKPEKPKTRAKKTKWTEEILDFIRDQDGEKTLIELAEMVEKKFGIKSSDKSIYAIISKRGIPFLRRPRRVAKPEKKVVELTPDMESSIREFMLENRHLSDKGILKNIEEKFGPDLGIKKVRFMRKKFRASYKGSNEFIWEDDETNPGPEDELDL